MSGTSPQQPPPNVTQSRMSDQERDLDQMQSALRTIRLSPANGPAGGGPWTMATLADMDPDMVPMELKKEGSDWFVIFNPQVQRKLDISLTLSLAHESVVCCVRFSSDGEYLATGCKTTAQIYNARTGAKIYTLIHEPPNKDADLYIRSVCFAPDGKLLATAAEDKLIRIWDIASQSIRQIFSGHQQEVYSLDFSKDGRLLVSGSGDKTARVWNMANGTHQVLAIVEPADVDAGVTSIAISPNGQHVAAGSLDTIVRIWDVTTGNLIERLRGHSDSVYSVAFAQYGRGLVSGSLDKTLKHWDLVLLHGNSLRVVALGQDEIVASGVQPVLKEGGENGSTCTITFSGHQDYALSVAMSPDDGWVVSGSKDRSVRFWDPQTGQTQLTLRGHKNSVISVDVSPVSNAAGGFLASGSGDWMARVWRYTLTA
ncbi:general transcription repressor [Tulasnella sp. JGI-2019a]|nr:general transcription repressor [Tulasnella sp. JGI-2019a]